MHYIQDWWSKRTSLTHSETSLDYNYLACEPQTHFREATTGNASAVRRLTTTTLSNVRELKTFLDCGFRIPDSLSWNLDFGFRIPWTVSQIPKPRILDFLRFRIPQAKLSRILESRFPHMGRTRIESVSHVLKYSNNHNLHKKIKSSSNLVVVTEASQD